MSSLRRIVFVSALILSSLATLLSAASPPKSETEMATSKLRDAHIVPDVIDQLPASAVTVKYGGELEVKMGNELTPRQVADKPSGISWTAEPGRLYTLAMVDPDAPSRTTPKNRNWLHWLVTNIPGSDVSKGNVVVDYAGSTPPQGTSKHRYVFLVFEQSGRVANVGKISGRGKFDLRKFAQDNNLGAPVAGNYFLAQHQS